LPRVALAAQLRRLYRLRNNGGAQTYLPQMRLKCGVHSDASQMPLMQIPSMNVFSYRSDWGFSKAVTDDNKELFHAGAVSPKGFDDA
jgi:hypothetical protein